jgi:hypothetical protein
VAAFKLDRHVQNFSAAEPRMSGRIVEGTRVVHVGHSFNLPVKIDDAPENVVMKTKTENNSGVEFLDFHTYFSAKFDAAGGASGSPVFSFDSGALEGIYVRGFAGFSDFVNRPLADGGTCKSEFVCSPDKEESCDLQHVIYSSVIFDYIAFETLRDNSPAKIVRSTPKNFSLKFDPQTQTTGFVDFEMNEQGVLVDLSIHAKLRFPIPLRLEPQIMAPDGTMLSLRTPWPYPKRHNGILHASYPFVTNFNLFQLMQKNPQGIWRIRFKDLTSEEDRKEAKLDREDFEWLGANVEWSITK